MSAADALALTAPAPPAPARPRRQRTAMSLKLDGVAGDSRRTAAAVLEVLAGVCTPGEAAGSLSMSLPAYYKLESRAVQGLIEGCKRPGRGPRPSVDDRVEKLTRQCHRLQQDLQRYQALARAAQRAAGLPTAPASQKAEPKGRRKRRPTVRALRAVEMLRANPGDQPLQSPAETAGDADDNGSR